MVIKYYKLNAKILQYPTETSLKINCDDNGVIIDKFWRRRIADSAVDNSMSLLKKKPKGHVVTI